MRAIGNAAVALIRRRTSSGRGYAGKFAAYSTKPIYITRGRGTGARLAPKGGRPSKTGRSVYYERGYAEYKQLSTGSGVINLTLSGQLLRTVRVAKASASSVTVTAGSESVRYAGAVNAKRPFMGIAEGELGVFKAVAADEIDRVLRSGANGR
jgi:hypothetical protein